MDDFQGMLKLLLDLCGSFVGYFELISQINDCYYDIEDINTRKP